MNFLLTKVQYIKGVGPKRASQLKRLNINTILDLLYHFPKNYEDRTLFTSLREAKINEKVNLEVEIIGPANIIRPRANFSILKIPFRDSSGQGYLVWFNQNYLKNKFKVGDRLRVNGLIKRMGGEIQVQNPDCEAINGQGKGPRVLPIYSLTEGLTNNQLIAFIRTALIEAKGYLSEPLPLEIRRKYGLMDIYQAIEYIHFPPTMSQARDARLRLVFEELLILQLGLLSLKSRTAKNSSGIKFKESQHMDSFIAKLPYSLTGAQRKVMDDINQDMTQEKQMNRLVQGDVGSGKTIVAALALLRCVESGYQGVMMAPTEILAGQHYDFLKSLFDPWGIKVSLLVGSLKEKEKLETLKNLEEGKIDILVGTHAIIQDRIQFNNLGLAITDEQHRFGVKQRAVLNQKGNNPDILVMTATPIPRTLALILYGDLDISIIDELPPGRKKIETYAVGPELIQRMNNFIKKNLDQGRQAYIVCPLIEESDGMELVSAEELYLNLKDDTFKDYKVGLLHGKMSSKEKDRIMLEFKEGQIQILVSTTVIEVGVNVPNSNIMVIYNAERFGLAQIHQLRGRVGRGEYQSYCILLNYSRSKIALERMRILQNSSDGFIISEKDLELRGPGEFFGTRQHGLPELKIANLFRDMEVLKLVQKEALEIIDNDPLLVKDQYQVIKGKIEELFKSKLEDLSLN